MQLIKFKFPIIKDIEIKIFNDELADFTIRQLSNYVINITSLKCKSAPVVEISSMEENIIGNFKLFFEKEQTISRNLEVYDNKLKNKECLYKLEDSILKINSSRKIAKRKWYKFFQKKRLKYSELHDMFYKMILFPIFSLYCVLDGYYLLHGSLIEIKDKYKMILGLDGVGKSSIADKLLNNGAKILADNFLLFNGLNAVPFNMVMRFELKQETNMKVIYQDKNLKEVLPKNIMFKTVKPSSAFILTISKKYYLNKVENVEGLLQMFLNNAPEINDANNFLAPFLFYNFNKKLNKNKNLDYLILGIPKGEISNYVEKINEF